MLLGDLVEESSPPSSAPPLPSSFFSSPRSSSSSFRTGSDFLRRSEEEAEAEAAEVAEAEVFVELTPPPPPVPGEDRLLFRPPEPEVAGIGTEVGVLRPELSLAEAASLKWFALIM